MLQKSVRLDAHPRRRPPAPPHPAPSGFLPESPPQPPRAIRLIFSRACVLVQASRATARSSNGSSAASRARHSSPPISRIGVAKTELCCVSVLCWDILGRTHPLLHSRTRVPKNLRNTVGFFAQHAGLLAADAIFPARRGEPTAAPAPCRRPSTRTGGSSHRILTYFRLHSAQLGCAPTHTS